tara:strand:- start:1283 stop:2134 length:852 start_codon:yes stop_codon:yes gene_type:complete
MPNAWAPRDIQSLDARIMNTKQWLKIEKSNFKYLSKVMKIELNYYRKNDFRVFKDLDREMRSINKYLDKIKSSLNKQVKLATKIKKKPSIGVFADNNEQNKKRFFAKKNNSISTVNKSEKAVKIINNLEKNSMVILENQSNYNASIDNLKFIFKKKKYRLVFIRDQIKRWNHEIREITHEREKLDPIIDNFNLILSEALFKSAESSYAKNIIALSKRIERYKDEMNKFESFVMNLESIAGKQVKGLVYIIKNKEKKNYQKKYEKELSNYQNILKEIPKLINSV